MHQHTNKTLLKKSYSERRNSVATLFPPVTSEYPYVLESSLQTEGRAQTRIYGSKRRYQENGKNT